MAYNSCYMESLGYGTAATSLSMDECKEIQKPPVYAILPKMGIHQNTKREVFQECWRFLKQCDVTMETTGTWKPLRGRKGDVALMEVFANKNFTAK
jgi:hypothetical protein